MFSNEIKTNNIESSLNDLIEKQSNNKENFEIKTKIEYNESISKNNMETLTPINGLTPEDEGN